MPQLRSLRRRFACLFLAGVFCFGSARGQESSIEPLVAALRSGDESARLEAARALGEAGDKAASDALYAALRDGSSMVGLEAASALRKLGWAPGNRGEEVAFLLATEEWSQLSDLGPEGVDLMIEELQRTGSGLMAESVKALGVAGDTRAVMPIIEVLRSGDRAPRLKAAWSLGRLRDARAVEPLIVSMEDENLWLRRDSAWALAEIGDPRAVKHLVLRLADESQHVQKRAVQSISQFHGPEVAPLVLPYLKNDRESVRMFAAQTLGYLRDASALEPLQAALADSSHYVRTWAAWALGEIGDPRAESSLVANLTDWSSSLKVAEALDNLGWDAATDADRIHDLVARSRGAELRESWDLARAVLLDDVRSGDYRVVENALFAFIGLGREEMISVLTDVLSEEGTRTMAEAYLHCGHDALASAAQAWAEDKGERIETRAGGTKVRWGSF